MAYVWYEWPITYLLDVDIFEFRPIPLPNTGVGYLASRACLAFLFFLLLTVMYCRLYARGYFVQPRRASGPDFWASSAPAQQEAIVG
jgi:hypothetical protein